MTHLDINLMHKEPHIYVPKVLLIEDDPPTRWLVRTALKDTCILSTVTSVDNFMIHLKAINQFDSFKPDIAILDINLPPANGTSILKDLIEIHPNAYVVMFSSHNSEDNIRLSLELGAKGFISKPFAKQDLIDHIEESILWKKSLE